MTENKPTNIPQIGPGESETVDVLYVFTDRGTYREGDPVPSGIAIPISSPDQLNFVEDLAAEKRPSV